MKINEKIKKIVEEAEAELLPIPCPVRFLENKGGSYRYYLNDSDVFVSAVYIFLNANDRYYVKAGMVIGPERKPICNLMKILDDNSFEINAHSKNHPCIPKDIDFKLDRTAIALSKIPNDWEEFKEFCDEENIFYQSERIYKPNLNKQIRGLEK